MWQRQEQQRKMLNIEKRNVELTRLRLGHGNLSQSIDYKRVESLLPDPASQTMFYKLIAQIENPQQIIPPPPPPVQSPHLPKYWLHVAVIPYEEEEAGLNPSSGFGVIVRDSNTTVYSIFCDRWLQIGPNPEVDMFGAILSFCLTNGLHPLSAASENNHVVETFTNIRAFHPLNQFDLEIVHVQSDANRTAQTIAQMAPFHDNSLWNKMEIVHCFAPHVPFV